MKHKKTFSFHRKMRIRYKNRNTILLLKWGWKMQHNCLYFLHWESANGNGRKKNSLFLFYYCGASLHQQRRKKTEVTSAVPFPEGKQNKNKKQENTRVWNTHEWIEKFLLFCSYLYIKKTFFFGKKKNTIKKGTEGKWRNLCENFRNRSQSIVEKKRENQYFIAPDI